MAIITGSYKSLDVFFLLLRPSSGLSSVYLSSVASFASFVQQLLTNVVPLHHVGDLACFGRSSILLSVQDPFVSCFVDKFLLFWLACFVGLFQLNRYTRYAVLAFACLPRVVYS